MPEGLLHKSRVDLTGMACCAVFSPDEAYRYRLEWRWGDICSVPLVALMLNPSTATHEVLDPTITGLVKRARAWGMGGVVVINLFAIRATDPKVMLRADEPVGPANDAIIEHVLRHEVALRGAVGIAAWGAHGKHRGRDAEVLAIADSVGAPLHALHINDDGSPKHPLYIRHDIRPSPWRPAA